MESIFKGLNIIEGIGAFLGILSMIYLQAGRISGYILGLFSVSAYVWICFEAKMYAHMSLNVYYIFMNVYGGYYWLRGDKGSKAPYSYCRLKEHVLAVLIMLACFSILYLTLAKTDSQTTLLEALTAAIWIVAMWLMARKRIECWLWWIVGDIICVPLYFAQDLIFTSAQMLIFLIIASIGFFSWQNAYSKQQATATVAP